MTPKRKLIVTVLGVCGFIFSFAGIILNTALLFKNPNPSITDPIFAPSGAIVVGIGALCFIVGAILGWSNRGTYVPEIPPSNEPKSLVLRMPSNRKYDGTLTLKMRNGDNHDFETTSEVLQLLEPGMIGTARILRSKLLSFEPDSEQPNLKSKREP